MTATETTLRDPDEKGRRPRLSIPALGARVVAAAPIRVDPDGRTLWVYRDGVYHQDDGTIGALLGEFIGDAWLPAHSNGVRQWLAETQPRLPADPDPDLLNVANGMLRWRTGDLLPHDPSHGSTAQSPWPWDPKAECPTFLATFSALPPGVLDLVFEIAGYLLWPSGPYKKAFLLHGTGNTGKTTLLNVLTSLIGAENVSHQTLQAIAEERFARVDLFGKRANIVGDLDARNVVASDYFKMMVGGDKVQAERKGQPSFSFTNRAKMVFSANRLPGTLDQSDAWFDRFIIIPMMSKPEAPDPSLREGLAKDPAEMAGVLRYAVEALRRLEKRGKFAPPPSVVEAGAAYRDQADNVRSFFKDEDEWVLDPSAAIPRSEVYRLYKEWCSHSGKRPAADSEVYARIETDGLGMGLRLGKDTKGKRVVRGVCFVGHAAPAHNRA